MATDIKYDFETYDCTPGDAFNAFEERYLNALTLTDDQGYSLADHVLDVDEGGGGGPAIAGTPAQIAKKQAARRKRSNASYGMLLKHLVGGSAADHITYMRQNHFQNGFAAFTYLAQMCRTPISLECS